jgi:hypothetical protein
MRRTILACGAAALLAIAGGCSESSSAPSDVFKREVVLSVGQTARIAEAEFSLRFDRVTSDTRCPADVLCIQAGDASVLVTVLWALDRSTSYELHTSAPSSVRHRDVRIALEALAPYPFSSKPIDPASYTATLLVTRG